MDIALDLIKGIFEQGFIYAMLSFGIFITYKILDFPDLTVDGSFPLGAAVTAVCVTNGMNPYLTLLVSLAAGAMAGLVTGIIHVKFKVRDLLSGIITMTALYSINMQIVGKANLALIGCDTIFKNDLVSAIIPEALLPYRTLIISFLIMAIAKILVDLYMKTKSGLLLRAVGDNSTLVTSLAKDKGTIKIIGLVISNALVALSGSVVCHQQKAFNITMGTGQMVFGLATVIIGTSMFRRFGFIKSTTAVAAGSVIYKACIQIAISLGLPSDMMKFITAALFLVILIITNFNKKGVVKHA